MLSVLFLSAQFGVALTSILSAILDLVQFAQNVRSTRPRWLLQILGLASFASLLRNCHGFIRVLLLPRRLLAALFLAEFLLSPVPSYFSVVPFGLVF